MPSQMEVMRLQFLKSDDPGRVIDILKGSGFDVYTADEAYRANV
mgnify:CR=1 FL=1